MSALTPMMKQYQNIKKEYENCILFFRLGDFYEMFFEDALTASKELDIALTSRACGNGEKAPMCGVPYHSSESYIAKLVELGYKVAICEQMEDPKTTKTIVKREVIRVVTPGTITDGNSLDSSKNNYIMSIFEDKYGYGLSFADVTTGEFICIDLNVTENDKIIDEIYKYSPAEIICNHNFSEKEMIEELFKIKLSIFDSWAFEYKTSKKKLIDHFQVFNLSGYGIEEEEHSVSASGALLQYLYDTQKNSLSHITSIKKYRKDKFMALDVSSRRNLELTETIREKRKKGSLLWILDKTKTSLGARNLRKWLEQPLIDSNEINLRLDSVEELKNEPLLSEEIKEFLNTIYDIERIMGRIIYGTANARDFVSLKNSIRYFPDIKNLLSEFKSELNYQLFNKFNTLDNIFDLLESAFVDEPPFSIREGGFIKSCFNRELDKYQEAKQKGNNWLLDMEKREKEATGIKNLKIRYNKVFGYYIEITNSYKNLVPARYVRRQTLSNCERYTTNELKEIEDAILGADERIVELEYNIFVDIRDSIAKEVVIIQQSAEVIAEIDTLISFASISNNNVYVKPTIDDSGIIDIKNGRHPVVEHLSPTSFVCNDTLLNNEDDRLAIITGPNMAGKSTYMRQTALIVLMAQIGCFVPADNAHIGVVDRIFTRVGASDDLATGQSTFMIEMNEVANILNNSTKHSLLILDEIGRGTSTYDGLSIAWSVLEYIADKDNIGAKTLFATHYHELTELEGKVDGVKNYCITVKEEGDDIIFLRKVIRGGVDRSYGIQVAKLAGIPDVIIERSKQILKALNETDINREKISDKHYYDDVEEQTLINNQRIVFNEIKEMNIEALTPREALRKLQALKSKTQQTYKK